MCVQSHNCTSKIIDNAKIDLCKILRLRHIYNLMKTQDKNKFLYKILTCLIELN